MRRTEDVDGSIVDARLTGRTARVVVSSYPRRSTGPPSCARCPAAGCRSAASRTRAAATDRDAPRRRLQRRPPPAPCSPGPGVLTVYTVDLDKGLPAVDADAVFTDADTVYASPTSLYVATQR